MTNSHRPSKIRSVPFEVYMIVRDPKKITRLMAIQGVSGRRVAEAAGWKSHTYLQRILRGEIRTIELDRAMRIAAYLQVDVYDIFAQRTSRDHAQPVPRQSTRKAAA